MTKNADGNKGAADIANNSNANSNKNVSKSYETRNFSIPVELRRLRQWGVAKAVWNKEKRKYLKYPFQVNGQPAKSNDPSTWTWFWNVRNAEFLAFFFNHNYTGMDFDHVIKHGVVDEWVQKNFIEPVKSYTEISISGTGVHLITKGGKPAGLGSNIALKNGHSIEIYDSGRFFLFTGNVYQNYRGIGELDQYSFFKDYLKPEFHGPNLPVKIGSGVKDLAGIIDTLEPYWARGDNKRHFLMLRLSGYIASCGGTESDLQTVIRELIRRTKQGQYRPWIVERAFMNSRYRLEYNAKVSPKQRLKVSGENSLLEIMEAIANEQ